MNSTDLLKDTLGPEALAPSLAAARTAARHRRLCRHAARTSLVLTAAASLGLAVFRSHRAAAPTSPLAGPPPAAVDHAPAPPAFLAVTTRSDPTCTVVTTPPSASVVVTTPSTPAVSVISTRGMAASHALASEAELFAAAGPRPAALQRHRDGTARWVWLDQTAARN